MEILPIHNTRALKIELEGEKVLIVADLHIGISAELAKKGIEIPSQAKKIEKKLIRLIEKEKSDRLFLLGDIKHNIPITSWEEWSNLPGFFSKLNDKTRVEVIPGNHDGDIEGLITKNIILHGPEGTTVGNGKVGLIHGHAWPAPKLLEAEEIIMGHNHPIIEFKDNLGGRVTEPAWIRGKIIPEKFPKRFQKHLEGKRPPKITIIPAFSELVGGGAINREIPEKLLGPLFKSGAIDLEEAEVYLLDGTFLGKLKNLRGLNKTD